MTRSNSTRIADFNDFEPKSSAEFHRQVAEGLRRAPIERSIAIRSFWNSLFN